MAKNRRFSDRKSEKRNFSDFELLSKVLFNAPLGPDLFFVEHEVFENFSIMGSKFTGRIVGTTRLNNETEAIIPEITGNAFITAFSKIVVDPDDQFPTGFTVGDIWAE